MLHTSITIAAIPTMQTPAQANASKIINQNLVPQAPTTIKAVAIPKTTRMKMCMKRSPTICIAHANKLVFSILFGFLIIKSLSPLQYYNIKNNNIQCTTHYFWPIKVFGHSAENLLCKLSATFFQKKVLAAGGLSYPSPNRAERMAMASSSVRVRGALL